jgi:hypothetical protein
LDSIPAPLELDSDPEFNTGAFVYETKEKRKRGRKSTDTSPPRKSRTRRSNVLGGTRPSISSGNASRRTEEPKTNPLLQYFGNDLDLHSASEDEDGTEVDDEVSNVGSNDGNGEDPVISRTLTVFAQSKEATPNKNVLIPVVDNSETESESEAEPVVRTRKRKSPSFAQITAPSKRRQTPLVNDDSMTESESEDELAKSVRSTAQMVSLVPSDSETESEDEEDTIANPVCTPLALRRFPCIKPVFYRHSILDQASRCATARNTSLLLS